MIPIYRGSNLSYIYLISAIRDVGLLQVLFSSSTIPKFHRYCVGISLCLLYIGMTSIDDHKVRFPLPLASAWGGKLSL